MTHTLRPETAGEREYRAPVRVLTVSREAYAKDKKKAYVLSEEWR